MGIRGVDLFRKPKPQEAHPAARLLEALGATVSTFQVFDDDDERQAKHLATYRTGTFTQWREFLLGKNREGAGVFFMVAEGDGKGRSKQNVVGLRAYFADLDGTPVLPLETYPLLPTAVVESSPGRFHLYWRVTDAPTEADSFAHVQRSVADLLEGDTVVIDLPRVMRLPGFLHQKGEPWCVKLRHLDRAAVYDHAQFVHAFGIPAPRVIPPLPLAAQSYISENGGKPRTDNRPVLYDRVASAGNGQRNHTLFQTAAALANDVHEGLLPEAMYREELAIAAQHAGLSLQEAEKTINSALRYAGRS